MKTIRVSLLFFLVTTLLWAADNPAKSAEKHLKTPRVFHVPKEVLLQGYPYDIDLIVDIPTDSLASVILMFRVNDQKGFREIPMEISRERYRFHYDPRGMPADSLEYYFVVTLTDESIIAAPLDKKGNLTPVKRPLVDPQEYFRQRNLFKQ